ncbi:SCP2 sterol-binding domain-containing protein [Conexibacter sp. SYSU D00693]|uniref:SCP2 sterol-binding domain-containing protein n=1 Tax=Conexibacter sp. SYSU D00693 TaxID=2812560 RepID=UPI00196B194D|nr:SCP2 sterol-binding domain-containing protein [Conexibacter sp. SYSU D00693]
MAALGPLLVRHGAPRLAHQVVSSSDEELERRLRSPLWGPPVLWAVLRAMPGRIARGSSLEAVVEWRVHTQRGRTLVRRLHVDAAGGRLTRAGAGDPPPDLVLELSDADLLRLAVGQRSVTWLVLRGRLRLEGSKVLAARLLLVVQPPPVPSALHGRRAPR